MPALSLKQKVNAKFGVTGCLIFLLISSFPLQAETLHVSIAASVSRALPEATQRIVRALNTTGYDIELVVLPNKRSVTMLRRGKIALEFFRSPSVTSEYHQIVKLQPRLQSLNFNMVTSVRTPNHCLVSEENYENLSIVGVLGIGLHRVEYYPKFGNATSVSDVQTALKFVSLQRADVTFLPNVILNLFPRDVMRDLITCPANYKTFDFFAHLHKDYIWAKEEIESALLAEFGIDSKKFELE